MATRVSGILPPGSKFFDVDGVPVALMGPAVEPTSPFKSPVMAFDSTPRPFPVASLYRNGSEAQAEAWDGLIEFFAGSTEARAGA